MCKVFGQRSGVADVAAGSEAVCAVPEFESVYLRVVDGDWCEQEVGEAIVSK